MLWSAIPGASRRSSIAAGRSGRTGDCRPPPSATKAATAARKNDATRPKQSALSARPPASASSSQRRGRPPAEEVRVRTSRAADAGHPEAEDPDGGGATEREGGSPHLQEDESETHDEQTHPHGGEHQHVPGRMVAEGMPREQQRDAHGTDDADCSGGGEQPGGAAPSQLDVALEGREDPRARALAKLRRRGLLRHPAP